MLLEGGVGGGAEKQQMEWNAPFTLFSIAPRPSTHIKTNLRSLHGPTLRLQLRVWLLLMGL